jgi:hypothetical protein
MASLAWKWSVSETTLKSARRNAGERNLLILFYRGVLALVPLAATKELCYLILT